MLTVTVTGGEQALRAMDDLAARCTSNELLGVVITGAIIIQDAWKERVPVHTGRYHDSIHIETLTATPGDFEVAVTTSAVNPDDEYPYPYVLEYGSATNAARPSATPALEETRDEVMETMRQLLEEIVTRGTK
jgi:HK97 gp10 family phage protein